MHFQLNANQLDNSKYWLLNMRHLYILQITANLHSKSGISYMNIGEWWLPDKCEIGYILTTNGIFNVEMSIFQRKLNHKFLWDIDLNGYPDQTIGWCGRKQRKSYHIVECWLSLKETEKMWYFDKLN